MIESVRPVVALKMLRLLKIIWENKEVDLLESDLELVTFYYTNDKCILMGRVNEIIESGDSSRLKNILVLLESFNDDRF
jgi:hypothetical protein